ncbi:MAG: hypothetical protein ACE5I2_06630 [Anaerolineae bacterium]
MRKKQWTILGLALGTLMLGVLVGLMTVGTVAADPTPGVKIQIPRIDVGEGITFGTGPWETWIQVQNVGITDTLAIFLGWGDYSEKCPTNDPGVIAHYCQSVKENGVWTLRTRLTDTVKSGIIYSVRADVHTEACSAAELTEGDTDAWRCWKEEWEYGTCEDKGGGWNNPPVEPEDAYGEELAVTVNRYGPNDYDTFVSSTYTGISEKMEGQDPPYNYYAPYIMKGYNGLDTEITIQNSGQECTSLEIDYLEQGTCYIIHRQHIEQLAPGEAIRLKVPCDVGAVQCPWLGSAHISSEMPLGIIVDQTSFAEPCGTVDRGTLLTYRARPKIEVRDGEIVEDTLVYADLIFREWNGWDASVQVQNLSRTGQRTFVTVDFLDNSGDEILFLADWVCPTGSATFYLPVIYDLGVVYPQYVGAAEIQSHDQVSFPGEKTPAQPIFAVVDLKKSDDPDTGWMDAQGGSYNAHPYSQKEWVSEIALPFMAKDAQDMYTPWTSMIVIRNNSNCNKIKPKIWFKDETGDLVCELNSFWIRPKHVKLIDLNDIGCLYPGYVGAAKVIVEEFEQLCDVDNDGHIDNEPLMPSVIVVEKGLPFGGDVTKIYEGIPYATNIPPCYGDILGKVHSIDPGEDNGFDASEPILGTLVTVSGLYTDTVNSTGDYEAEDVVAGADLPVEFSMSDFLTYTTSVDLDCGEDEMLDAELLCLGEVGFKVMSFVTDTEASIIAGASVEYSKPYPAKADHYGDYYRTDGETDNTGVLTLTVPILNATGTFTVSAPSIAETGVFTWTQMVNTPKVTTTHSIFAAGYWDGKALNSRIFSGTTGSKIVSKKGQWYGFDDGSCANIGSASRSLNNQDVELLLCRFGTVAGNVKIGEVNASGRLVEVIQDGKVVGSDTTGVNGNYIIDGIATGCFSKQPLNAGCKNYYVRVAGVLTGPYGPWEHCGDVDTRNFKDFVWVP